MNSDREHPDLLPKEHTRSAESSVDLTFAPSLCSVASCRITQLQLAAFRKRGLVLGADFYEQCSVGIVLCVCRSLSQESNWGGLLGPGLCAHSAFPGLARLFSRVFFVLN